MFAGNDCSDVFWQKGEITFKIQFFGPDRLLHNLQQFAVKKFWTLWAQGFWRRKNYERQESIWRMAWRGPLKLSRPQISRSWRQRKLHHVHWHAHLCPFHRHFDQTRWHHDILTDTREDTMMAAKCFTSSGLACCCGSPIARQYNLLPAKTATNFQTWQSEWALAAEMMKTTHISLLSEGRA